MRGILTMNNFNRFYSLRLVPIPNNATFTYFPTSIPSSSLKFNNFYSSLSQPSTQKRKSETSSQNSLTEAPESSQNAVSLSLGEKVKENAKTGAYGGVVLLGIAITGAMGYLILSELMSSNSPNNIYTKSYKLCKANTEVQNVLGEPIKCYGEETRRGWRRHVAQQQFMIGDTKYIRMRFYLEGPFNKGTVYLEKKTDESGKFNYSYLFVDVDTYPQRRIQIDVTNF